MAHESAGSGRIPEASVGVVTLRGSVRRAPTGRVLGRYLLFQTPGWILAVAVLGGLVHWEQISVRTACILFGLWIVKDLVLFPVLRIGYEPGSSNASDGLVGAHAVAAEALRPRGYVRVGSELWCAELADETASVPPGGQLRVVGLRGLTLRVEPARDDLAPEKPGGA